MRDDLYDDADFSGPYARDTHRGGYGDDYAREGARGAFHHRGRGPKNYRRSDERIREEVNERLTADDDVDATEIDVKVENGVVTLNGFVHSRYEKRRAEDISDRVRGVDDVMNALRVAASDREIEIGKASE